MKAHTSSGVVFLEPLCGIPGSRSCCFECRSPGVFLWNTDGSSLEREPLDPAGPARRFQSSLFTSQRVESQQWRP